jgi:sugar lactone lactonase YvrE
MGECGKLGLVVWLALCVATTGVACSSSPAGVRTMEPAPTADGGAGGSVAGGQGGSAPAPPPDASGSAGGSGGSPVPPPAEDSGATSTAGPPEAGPAQPPLGPFPLDAIKAATPQLYGRAATHVEGPSFRGTDLFFAADGAGWGLMRIDADRKLYRYQPKLAPIGTYALADGSMLLCDHDVANTLVQLFADGKAAVLPSDYMGQPQGEFCNDVAVDGAGNIYFTARHAGHIFRVTPAGEVSRVATGLGGLPNGVEVDRESKYLYFGTTGALMRMALPASAGDPFGKPEMLGAAPQSDGMQFDAWGNLWVVVYGARSIRVFAPDGKVITNVDPGGPPINLTFGGKDNDTLFVAIDGRGINKIGPIPGLRGFLHPGAPKYQIKKMLDLVPANTPVP